MQFSYIFQAILVVLSVKNGSALFKRRIYNDNYTEDDLPQLYAMENYNKCLDRNGTFCIVDFRIKPKDENSKVSQEIEKSKQSQMRFDRSKVYRMMCILENQTSDMDNVLKKSVDRELQNFNLYTEIEKTQCDAKFALTSYDYVYAVVLLAYAALVIKSSKYDLLDKKKKNFVKSKYDKLYNIFSIKKNWAKIFQENKNADYQRLKFIQGVRFYAMLMVVICHTKLSFGSLFVENPIGIEKLLEAVFYSVQLDLFIIQTFFMISTFLLTNQIYEIYRSNGKFTVYDCWLLYINRVMRLFPTVLLVIILVQLLTKTAPIGPQVWSLFLMVFQECQTNWWLTLFQMNFVLTFNQMCMPGSWYLGVDTLLYVTTVLLLYVTLKFKLDLKKVLGTTFVVMSAKFAHVIYVNNFDVMFIANVESFRDLYHSYDFSNLYISPWSSYSTCCVGIATGAIYYHIKNMDIKLTKVHSLIWYLSIFCVPFLLVYIGTREYESILVRMLLGPLLKPTFAVAMGIGMLGLTKNLGAGIKKILEWDFAIMMSNFTYCVYLFHFLMVFSKGVFSHHLIYFEFYEMWIWFFIDVIASFLIGGLCTLTVELPWSEVQKLYMPQVRKGTKEEKNYKSENDQVLNRNQFLVRKKK